jgi:hypothetical protein
MRQYSEKEMGHIIFYGNSIEFNAQVDEIRSYLNEVHKFIEITNIHLQNDKIKGYDKDTLEDMKYNFEHTHGDILRKSIIISIIILLESGIDIYCRDFQKYMKLKISFKELKGDLLERFKIYSQKILNSSFDFSSQLWQDIVGLYEIRNCIIHNNGLLDNFGKRTLIEVFIKRNKRFEITDSDFIDITHNGCLLGLDIVDTFYKAITEFAFDLFPDFK